MFSSFGSVTGLTSAGAPFIEAAGDLLVGAVAIGFLLAVLGLVIRSRGGGSDSSDSPISTGAPSSRPRRPS